MPQTEINIQHAAKLARLKLTDAEAAEFQTQIANILDYMKHLEAHDLSNVEPTAHAMPIYDVWREDEPAESFSSQEALSNAPKKGSNQFLITRVIEE